MNAPRVVAFCPHCGNRAPQRVVHKHEYLCEAFNGDGSRSEEGVPSKYWVVVCETCDDLLVYSAFGYIPEDFEFAGPDTYLVWPKPRALHESIPARVRDIYDEASAIREVAPNAFAGQIRRALEALCDDRGAQGRSLQDRLEDLVHRNELPPVLAEMTTVLRLLGNTGAHYSEQSVRPGHVGTIDEFFRAVVEYVYVAPSKVAKFRKRLERLAGERPAADA